VTESTRRVTIVLVPTIAFGVARVSPSFLLSLALLAQSPPRPDTLGDFIVVLNIAGMTALFSAIGFAIPIALSRAWRQLTIVRGIVVAAALGLAAPIAALLVGALTSSLLLPLFRRGFWIASALFHGLPGLAVGAVAVVIAGAMASRGAKRQE